MGAPTFVGKHGFDGFSQGSQTYSDTPAGTQAGDLMVFVAVGNQSSDDTAIPAPDGGTWTRLGGWNSPTYTTNNVFNLRGAVYYKTATAADATAQSHFWSNNPGAVYLMVFRGTTGIALGTPRRRDTTKTASTASMATGGRAAMAVSLVVAQANQNIDGSHVLPVAQTGGWDLRHTVRDLEASSAKRTSGFFTRVVPANSASGDFGYTLSGMSPDFDSNNNFAGVQVLITGTNDAPNTPSGLSPSGNITTVKPMLRATVSDPDGGSVYAQFQVATDSGFTNVVTSGNGSTVASGTTSELRCPIDLNSSTNYYVRARAVDNEGAVSAYSSGVLFTTPAPITTSFAHTGGAQNFVVPTGVTRISVVADGAAGGPNYAGGTGGRGGRATGTITVTPGETLQVNVGGMGQRATVANGGAGGFNGGGKAGTAANGSSGDQPGGSGGGASDVRRGGTALANRVIVAGGGGGAPRNVGSTANDGRGAGGGLSGAGALSATEGTAGSGSQSTGGALTENGFDIGNAGNPGTLGVGGGNSGFAEYYQVGGGGGFYGGGCTVGGSGGAGGYAGGGSSLVPSGGTTTLAGGSTGHGAVTLTYARYDETANAAPSAPTLVAPAAGATVPRKAGQFFDWTHSDPNSDPQNAYALRLTRDTVNYWWNGSGWNTAETFVASGSDSATVDPSSIPAGSYTWAVATTDGKGGTSPYSATRTFTLNSSPNAPILNSPADNAAPDLAAGVLFDWTHSDPEGDAQTGWQFRRAVKSATPTYEFYNVGTAAWQSTPVTNTGSVDEYQFPAGKWAAGTTYLWSVATVDGGSTLVGPFAADRTVAAQAPPAAPTLVSPANSGYADLAAGVMFDWTFSDPNPGDTQGAFAIRRKISGAAAYEYYNVGTAAWQATEVFNTGTADQFTFPSGKWTSGTIYNWSVATRDQSGNTGPYASDFTVTASTPPSVTVTAPTGSVSGTTRPAVTWTYTDTQNDPQSAFQVKVFTEAQFGASGFNPATSPATVDSGVISAAGSRSYQLQTDLLVGVNYRAYVQVTQVGGQTSPWAFSGFVLTVNTPAIPILSALVQPQSGRVQLSVETNENLLSAQQASAETDASGVTAMGGSTVARSTDQALNGAASFAITKANTAGDMALAWASIPVQPGRTYTGLASTRAAATARTLYQYLDWYDSGGALIRSDYLGPTGYTVADTTTGWTQVTTSGTAPANAATVRFIVGWFGAALNEVHYADAIKVAPGSSTQFSRGGLAGIVDVMMERSEDGGATWTPVRGTPVRINAADQRATVFDYEAKPQGTVLYRARSSAEV